MEAPRCASCGSTRLARAHMQKGWQRLLKRHTLWRRYACNDCQRRGWTRRPLVESDHPEEQRRRAALAGETTGAVRLRSRRDRKARRRDLLRLTVTVAVAVGLGVLLALYLLRGGGE